jgi:hypothetical protein
VSKRITDHTQERHVESMRKGHQQSLTE